MRRWLIVFLSLGILLAGRARSLGTETDKKEIVYQGKTLAEWIKGLQDKDPEVRLKSVSAIGHIRRADAAVPALTDALKDEDSYVREDAAFALGHIGPKARPAVPALVGALKDKDISVREKAAAALGKIGLEDEIVVPALTEALKEKDVRLNAAKALERFGPQAKEAVPVLIDMVKEPVAGGSPKKHLARLYATEALGSIGPGAKEAVPALLEALKDKDERVHEAVVDALKKIDPEAAQQAGVP